MYTFQWNQYITLHLKIFCKLCSWFFIHEANELPSRHSIPFFFSVYRLLGSSRLAKSHFLITSSDTSFFLSLVTDYTIINTFVLTFRQNWLSLSELLHAKYRNNWKPTMNCNILIPLWDIIIISYLLKE